MHVMAGDLPGFEEACRALFGGDFDKLEEEIRAWPPDIRVHTRELVQRARVLAHEQRPGKMKRTLPRGRIPPDPKGGGRCPSQSDS